MPDPEYPRVQVDELPDAPNPTAHKKEVDEALGIESFGFNVYTAHPGERLPWGYHSHPDHEELLYVVEGELAVEISDPSGEAGNGDETSSRDTFRVEAGEALFVPPNAPQCARAVGEESTKVIAVGAPKESDSAVISEYCPTCDTATDRTYEAVEEGGNPVYVLSCAACGVETDRLHAGPE